MEEEASPYEFESGEQRKEIFARLVSFIFERFLKNAGAFFSTFLRVTRRFVRRALWMLTGRQW